MHTLKVSLWKKIIPQVFAMQKAICPNAGTFGDNINIMLAAAAFNFKRMMNKWKKILFGLHPEFVRDLISRATSYLLVKYGFLRTD